MKKNPKISVLMPVYNAEQYLKDCIESILNQTFTDFELLIFNDASTDRSYDIIKSFSDDRIICYHSDVNKGYVEHLNYGLGIAKGEYIARMDADDISTPNRFEVQVQFLDQHKDIGICGSWCKLIRDDSNDNHVVVGEVVKSLVHEDIVAELYMGNPFIHSSVMFRKGILGKHSLSYDQDYYTAEDYRLWYLLSSMTRLHVIDKYLIYYRLHNENISKSKKELQVINANRVRVDILCDRIGISLKEEDKKAVYTFLSQKKVNPNQFTIVDAFFQSLYQSAKSNKERKEFKHFIKNHFLWYIQKNHFNLNDLVCLRGRSLYLAGIQSIAKFICKCLF